MLVLISSNPPQIGKHPSGLLNSDFPYVVLLYIFLLFFLYEFNTFLV